MAGLTIGDDTFEVRVEGDPTKPALLLSNALGTDLSIWDTQIPALTKHFRVIRYDPRGHGASLTGKAPASFEQFGKDALAILDALEIEKTHALGLSMGGAVVIWLLVNAPHRIDRAVLASTAGRFSSADAWNRRITSVRRGDMRDNATATMERWFSPEFAAREPERVQAVYDMLCNASPQGYADACAALRDMDLRAALDSIEGEVLVLSGRDDQSVPQTPAAGIAGAQHVVLNARHMSNIEACADFDAAVVSFLTRPKRRTASPRRKPTRRVSPPLKRGGAGRRSDAARRPLKKSPAKQSVTKTTRSASTAKRAEAHRRPTKKRDATRRPPPKKTAKQPAKKTATRKLATRRATPTAKARGAVVKPKTQKRPAKAAVKKAAVKTTKKTATTRRKPAGKPRRPKGRR